jgi:TPR repeat protein
MGNLCISYLHGNGVPRDMVQARQWALRSANLGEHRAMALMGNFHRHGLGTPVDNGEAMAWYMLSIEGCPDAGQAMRELMRELGMAGMSMLPDAKARAEVLRQGIRPTPYRD